jgi:short-subunit dehydrogenase
LLDVLAANLTQAHGTRCEVLVADLSTAEGVAEVLERTARHDVGLVVCSAGFGTAGRFLEGDIGEELDMLRVNCGAPTALSWGFGQRFASRGRVA